MTLDEQKKLERYELVDLFDGLATLLEIEDDSHRWITSGITDIPERKNIDSTLAYQYILKLHPYVNQNKIILEESEFYNSNFELSDHHKTMTYQQAGKTPKT